MDRQPIGHQLVGKNCIFRTREGVFIGRLKTRDRKEVLIEDCRRIFGWSPSISSLSELAVKGTHCPEECQFSIATPVTLLTDVTEILLVTEEAMESLHKVPAWTG